MTEISVCKSCKANGIVKLITTGHKEYYIICSECDNKGTCHLHEKEAIDAWNRIQSN